MTVIDRKEVYRVRWDYLVHFRKMGMIEMVMQRGSWSLSTEEGMKMHSPHVDDDDEQVDVGGVFVICWLQDVLLDETKEMHPRDMARWTRLKAALSVDYVTTSIESFSRWNEGELMISIHAADVKGKEWDRVDQNDQLF